MFTLVANTFASSVNINVNGKNIPNGGIIVDGKTYVSVRNVFESLGYTVVDPPSIIATHLTEVIRNHIA